MQEPQTPKKAERADSTSNIQHEIKLLLRICKDNTAVVAAVIVILTGWSIFSYTLTSDGAINMFAPELIAAVPVLFSQQLVIFVSSMLFILAPTFMLFSGAYKDRTGKLHPVLLPANFTSGHKRRALPFARRTLIAWTVLFSLPGIMLALWIVGEVLLNGIVDTDTWLLGVSCLAAVGIDWWWSGRIRTPFRHRRTSPDKYSRFLFSAIQTVVMLVTVSLTVTYTTSANLGYGWTIAFAFLTPIAAATLQLFLITVVINASGRPGFARSLFYVGLGVFVMFCSFPPTSSLLLRNHFMTSSTAYAGCFRIAIEKDSGIPSTLIDSEFIGIDAQTWSVRMRAIAPIDNWIQVRKKESDGIVYRIKKENFTQTLSCGEEQKAQKKKS